MRAVVLALSVLALGVFLVTAPVWVLAALLAGTGFVIYGDEGAW